MKRKSMKRATGAALLCMALLCGCNKHDRPGGSEGSDLPTIRLNAGLRTLSKAAINNGTAFKAAVAGWESSGDADYAQAQTWLTGSDITASENAGTISLDQTQYYSQNSAVRTYIRAWYPAGTLSGGQVDFAGDEAYKGDGTDDVLLAAKVTGSALDSEAKTLVFSHPLTQLKFAVEGDADFSQTTAIRSITVLDACLPSGLDLTRDAVTYAGTSPLPVPGIDGTQLITTSRTLTGQAVMVQPFTGNTFQVDVETSVTTYRGVTVTIDGDAAFKPGKAYTITLSFAGIRVGTQASVTAWDDTGTGSGDVETE